MGVFGATPSEAYQGEMHKPSQFMVFQPGFTDYGVECVSVEVRPLDITLRPLLLPPRLSPSLHILCTNSHDGHSLTLY